jgi:hypothetical protein
LAKRAAHRHGWQTITYQCRGDEVTRRHKTFLATSELVSGRIRVVVVRFEDGGWAPYFRTDTSVEIRDILETVAARWAIVTGMGSGTFFAVDVAVWAEFHA